MDNGIMFESFQPRISDSSKVICENSFCCETAVFALEGSKIPLSCPKHRAENHVDDLSWKCQKRACTDVAVCGWLDDGLENWNPTACALHREEGQFIQSPLTCEVKNCFKFPSYATKGEKRRRFCEDHRSANMVYVYNRCCSVFDCSKLAVHNDLSNFSRAFCLKHCLKDELTLMNSMEPNLFSTMAVATRSTPTSNPVNSAELSIPVINNEPSYSAHDAQVFPSKNSNTDINTYPTCEKDGCFRIPNYGNQGLRTHCKSHKEPGMIYGVLRCEADGCTRNPSFAPIGDFRRRFCKAHSDETMVNVLFRQCSTPGCTERAAFASRNGLEEEKRACLLHRDESMSSRAHKCEHAQCIKQASYGILGEKPRFCATHRQIKMQQIRTRKCNASGCNRIPSYGREGQKRQYCKEHALDGMTYNAGCRCRFDGCSSTGSFNYRGNKNFVYCKTHKEPGMVDVVSRRCQHDDCELIATFGMMSERKKRFCSKHKGPEHVSCKEWTPSAQKALGQPHKKRRREELVATNLGSAFTPIGSGRRPHTNSNSNMRTHQNLLHELPISNWASLTEADPKESHADILMNLPHLEFERYESNLPNELGIQTAGSSQGIHTGLHGGELDDTGGHIFDHEDTSFISDDLLMALMMRKIKDGGDIGGNKDVGGENGSCMV